MVWPRHQHSRNPLDCWICNSAWRSVLKYTSLDIFCKIFDGISYKVVKFCWFLQDSWHILNLFLAKLVQTFGKRDTINVWNDAMTTDHMMYDIIEYSYWGRARNRSKKASFADLRRKNMRLWICKRVPGKPLKRDYSNLTVGDSREHCSWLKHIVQTTCPSSPLLSVVKHVRNLEW